MSELGWTEPMLPEPDPYPERRMPSYCWRSWPPRHTDECGCDQKGDNGDPLDGPDAGLILEAHDLAERNYDL
jgi:hypothetical protein